MTGPSAPDDKPAAARPVSGLGDPVNQFADPSLSYFISEGPGSSVYTARPDLPPRGRPRRSMLLAALILIVLLAGIGLILALTL